MYTINKINKTMAQIVITGCGSSGEFPALLQQENWADVGFETGWKISFDINNQFFVIDWHYRDMDDPPLWWTEDEVPNIEPANLILAMDVMGKTAPNDSLVTMIWKMLNNK